MRTVPRLAWLDVRFAATGLAVAASLAVACGPRGVQLHTIDLPPGFTIGAFSTDTPGARSLAVGPGGTVFVGTRDEGRVYALQDLDGDGRADRTFVVAEGLRSPNGVAVHEGALFVAEIGRILRFENVEQRLGPPLPPAVVFDQYPDAARHGWKFIAFGPDGLLYVPVGAPCDACLSPEPIFATLTRLRPDGTGFEVFAHGVRNTVGFDWHPTTGELWFTDNGRDWLGADIPPDELNRASGPGLHFGFPFCHGADLPDPEVRGPRSCEDTQPPEAALGPHVAALGMRFYTGTMFPPEYRGQIFIAEHGSWNRADPIGYRVTLVTLGDDGRVRDYLPFAVGFRQPMGTWGRPVDVQVMPDGALLVSDDHAGAVYRIAYAP